MSNFNSLYIFAKGYAQLANGDQHITKNNSDLSSVQPLIDNIKSLRPDGVSEGDYHVIRIFKGVLIICHITALTVLCLLFL